MTKINEEVLRTAPGKQNQLTSTPKSRDHTNSQCLSNTLSNRLIEDSSALSPSSVTLIPSHLTSLLFFRSIEGYWRNQAHDHTEVNSLFAPHFAGVMAH